MNERINEFIKQSYVTVQSPSGEGYTHFSQEKFAELIVRQCADIAKHHVMNISTYGDAEFVDEQIKEHFGVEE
jgi:hypothetical protein